MVQKIRNQVRTCCYPENVFNLIARVNLFYTTTIVILVMAFNWRMSWCLSGHRYSLRSTSSTAVNAPDIVTSTGGIEDSHTGDEAAACDISCDEHKADSSNGTCDEVPAFHPFLLGTGYC